MESRQTKKPFYKDPANLFVISMVLIYFGWKVVHYLLLNTSPVLANQYNSFLFSLGVVYAHITSFILNFFGENTTYKGIWIIYMKDLRYVRVEEHCLAIPATIIFVGTIVLFSGSWLNKLWFIPLGVVSVGIINLMRLVFLSAIFEHSSETFYNINHSFIYVVLTYVLIMALIVWWIKSYGNIPAKPKMAQVAH